MATTTERLLGHLEWLRQSLGSMREGEQAVYNTAIRLRAETIKDRVPDAIVPRTTRRKLREQVDSLIDASRESDADTRQERLRTGTNSPHIFSLDKKIHSISRYCKRAKLFDGLAVEWKSASTPISWSEIIAITNSPHTDKDAATARSPEYRRRVLAAFKTILAASLAEARARTAAERDLASQCLETGAAMLACASDGLRNADARAGRRHDKAAAARISDREAARQRGRS